MTYFKAREAEYELRQKFWEKELPEEGESRALMLDQASKPAREFYRLSAKFLSVADRLEEREAVWTELLPQLQEKYEAHCGLCVIDLRTGDLVHWLWLQGIVRELYDVVVLPGVRRPSALGFKTDEIRRTITIGSSASPGG